MAGCLTRQLDTILQERERMRRTVVAAIIFAAGAMVADAQPAKEF